MSAIPVAPQAFQASQPLRLTSTAGRLGRIQLLGIHSMCVVVYILLMVVLLAGQSNEAANMWASVLGLVAILTAFGVLLMASARRAYGRGCRDFVAEYRDHSAPGILALRRQERPLSQQIRAASAPPTPSHNLTALSLPMLLVVFFVFDAVRRGG